MDPLQESEGQEIVSLPRRAVHISANIQLLWCLGDAVHLVGPVGIGIPRVGETR